MTDLADRYVAVWNESDPEQRRRLVRELWSADATQMLEPPDAILEATSPLAVDVLLEARGHGALEERVTRSYERFVAEGGFAFRRAGTAVRLHDTVKFRWEMVPRAGGEPAGSGLEIVVLGAGGLIERDYQFIES